MRLRLSCRIEVKLNDGSERGQPCEIRTNDWIPLWYVQDLLWVPACVVFVHFSGIFELLDYDRTRRVVATFTFSESPCLDLYQIFSSPLKSANFPSSPPSHHGYLLLSCISSLFL